MLSDAERVDDAVAGCTAIAMRRASLYGRAPVIHDLRIAFTIWGFLDPAPDRRARRPAGRRRSRASPIPHHYEELRALVDSVPEATLRMTPASVAETYSVSWRALSGRSSAPGALERRLAGVARLASLDHDTAWARRSSRPTNSSAETCVDSSTTGHAMPCVSASAQRAAQTHH